MGVHGRLAFNTAAEHGGRTCAWRLRRWRLVPFNYRFLRLGLGSPNPPLKAAFKTACLLLGYRVRVSPVYWV